MKPSVEGRPGKRAVQCALLAVLGAVAGTPSMAYAQATSATNATDLQGVVITGSRIRQIDKETALPVSVFTAKEIQETGALTVAQFLNELNENSFGSDAVPTSLASGGAAGASTISLRGLGATRTLVLLDGQRLPLDPSLTPPAANVNIIPLAIIDRVEILRDGASAIYGSDAIGGVVNIITRKKFDGMQASAQYDSPVQKGGKGLTASFIAGGSFSKGNAYFSYEHAKQDPITYADRPYLQQALSAYGDPGTIGVAIDSTSGAENTSLETPFTTCPASTGTSSKYPNSGLIYGGAYCGFNIGSQAWVTTGQIRDTLFGGVNYDFTDSISGFAKVMLTRSVAQAQSAAAPASSGFNNAYGLPEVGANNANNPDPGNDLYLLFRPTENGPRHDTITDTITDLMAGLKGSFRFLGDSEWELDVTNSGYRQSDIGSGYGLASALQSAIDNGTYDPFDPSSTPGGASSFAYSISNNNNYSQNTLGAHVTLDNLLAYTGSDFRLPLVVGLDYRDEKYQQIGDAQSQTSFTYGSDGSLDGYTLSNVFGNAGGSSQGSRSEWAAYGESQVGFFKDRVNIDGALRYDKYSIGGGKASPKISVALRPDEKLLLRATYSEGFRAPTLYDLYAGPAQSFDTAIDTWGCVNNVNETEPCSAGEQRQSFRVGSDTLKPETSRNFSAGFVLSPVRSVTLTADYYRITLSNGITQMTAQQVLNNDYTCREATGAACTDASTLGTVLRASNGAIEFVYEPKTNASSINTDGFDLSADYKLKTTDFGKFDFTLALTQVLSYRIQAGAGNEVYEEVGTLGTPSKRGSFTINWSLKQFSSTAVWHRTWSTADCDYATAKDSPSSCGTDRINSFNDVDLQLSYAAPWKGVFTVGVRNLFNLDPPASSFEAASTDTTGRYGAYTTGLYPIDGRVPYLRYTQTFR